MDLLEFRKKVEFDCSNEESGLSETFETHPEPSICNLLSREFFRNIQKMSLLGSERYGRSQKKSRMKHRTLMNKIVFVWSHESRCFWFDR